VVVAVSTLCVQAAQKASATVPIVMVAVADPIGEGFAVSLSRPGRNVTGLSNIVTEVSVKHLELLRAVVSRIARVGMLINPQNPTDALVLEQVQGAGYTRRIQILPVEASDADQIRAAFSALERARADAVIVTSDAYFGLQRKAIVQFALRQRLPLISSSREITEAGGLMSYGQDLAVHYRRAATYVDRILKGASPAALPIEQPTVLEFVVNRKTAAAIGLAVPPELLLRADSLIE
jgi:putative ABC transport system substrate-binding protein